MGANMGATRANDLPRQADDYGHAYDNLASSRTDPNDAERDAGNYGSEGWGFESLRARHVMSQDIGMTLNPRSAGWGF